MDTGNSERGVGSTGKRVDDLEVLGLSPDAAERDIRVAYRSWSRLFHPDHVSKDRAFQAQVLVARFKLVTAAYERIIASRN